MDRTPSWGRAPRRGPACRPGPASSRPARPCAPLRRERARTAVRRAAPITSTSGHASTSCFSSGSMQRHTRHGGANGGDGFAGRLLRVRRHPGHLLADVDELQVVRIDAALGRQLHERAFVFARRTCRHHDAVGPVFQHMLLEERLPLARADELDLRGIGFGKLRQQLRHDLIGVDGRGNIGATGAEVKSGLHESSLPASYLCANSSCDDLRGHKRDRFLYLRGQALAERGHVARLDRPEMHSSRGASFRSARPNSRATAMLPLCVVEVFRHVRDVVEREAMNRPRRAARHDGVHQMAPVVAGHGLHQLESAVVYLRHRDSGTSGKIAASGCARPRSPSRRPRPPGCPRR